MNFTQARSTIGRPHFNEQRWLRLPYAIRQGREDLTFVALYVDLDEAHVSRDRLRGRHRYHPVFDGGNAGQPRELIPVINRSPARQRK